VNFLPSGRQHNLLELTVAAVAPYKFEFSPKSVYRRRKSTLAVASHFQV
jgi:hypothetical protein